MSDGPAAAAPSDPDDDSASPDSEFDLSDGLGLNESSVDEIAEQTSFTIDLVGKAQDGDAAALDRLMERYYDRVLRIVRLRMGTRVRRGRESIDIVQDTFKAALKKFDKFEMREPASLIHWLAKIALNQIRAAADYDAAGKRDRDREKRWEDVLKKDVGSGVVFEPADDGPLALEQLSRAELFEVIDACVSELPEDYREVILLRIHMGGTPAFAAERMGRSIGAVNMLYARARVALLRLVTQRVKI